jgi:hypothetical protein
MADKTGIKRDYVLGATPRGYEDEGDGTWSPRVAARTKSFVWDPVGLAWVRETQAGGAGSGGSTPETAGINTYGLTSGVASADTATVVSYTAIAGFKLKGSLATGTDGGYFQLKVNGAVKAFFRTDTVNRTAQVLLPNFVTTAASDVVTISVLNTGDSTADFEGVIRGTS